MKTLTTDQLRTLFRDLSSGELIYFVGIGGCGMK